MIVIQREKVNEYEDDNDDSSRGAATFRTVLQEGARKVENQNQCQNDLLVMLDTIVEEPSIQEDKGTLFLFLIGFALLLILFFYIGKYILHK